MVKKVIYRITIIVILLCGFIAWGLYLMEIDDHYGNLQDVYFDSKSGDLIINKQTKNFGIITKNWKRADVITKENDTLDLYDLIYINEEENQYEVFRSVNNFKINELTFEKILELKKKNSIETVLQN